MTVSEDQIAKLRRMIAEPEETTYDDDALTEYIEACAVMDENGEDPTYLDHSTIPPTVTENEYWIPTYDLNAAAAEIWDEKAAAIQDQYDFTADGGSFHRSQSYEQACKMAAKYRSRSRIKSIETIKSPKEYTAYRSRWF
jgi:hypothetical protein